MRKLKKVIFATAFALAMSATITGVQAKDANGNLVIVLDPGHDHTHAGCSAFGELEGTLNFRIAQSCQAELSEYSGVKVYLTRESLACPFAGSDNRNCLMQRAAYAKSLNADYFISLHLNSDGGVGTAYGAEAYYPNRNYISGFTDNCRNLSNSILSSLSEIGIRNRGSKMNEEDSDESNIYPDGSKGDWYGVIRNGKNQNIPAIIIENAFLTNESDYNNFLSTDAKLQTVGAADAKGIASYFNLSKVPSNYTGMLEMDGEWKYYNNGEVVVDYTGMAQNEYGWWYYNDGRLDWNYTGMAENEYGWWYYSDGRLDWNYTGMAQNEYGWWYYSDGRLDWNYTGMAENEYGWWYYSNGRLDWNYTGWAQNQYGRWYFENGQLNWSIRG